MLGTGSSGGHREDVDVEPTVLELATRSYRYRSQRPPFGTDYLLSLVSTRCSWNRPSALSSPNVKTTRVDIEQAVAVSGKFQRMATGECVHIDIRMPRVVLANKDISCLGDVCARNWLTAPRSSIGSHRYRLAFMLLLKGTSQNYSSRKRST